MAPPTDTVLKDVLLYIKFKIKFPFILVCKKPHQLLFISFFLVFQVLDVLLPPGSSLQLYFPPSCAISFVWDEGGHSYMEGSGRGSRSPEKVSEQLASNDCGWLGQRYEYYDVLHYWYMYNGVLHYLYVYCSTLCCCSLICNSASVPYTASVMAFKWLFGVLQKQICLHEDLKYYEGYILFCLLLSMIIQQEKSDFG